MQQTVHYVQQSLGDIVHHGGGHADTGPYC